MTDKQIIGKTGENLAVNHLIAKGYKILETNWRYGHLEVDIIAQEGDFIVFCEVKTRKSSVFGSPEHSVNRLKQKNIIKAAQCYIKSHRISLEARFDIISITQEKKIPEIIHLEGAYTPKWC